MRDMLLVFVGGGAGSVCRWLISLGMQRWVPGAFPWATLLVNVIGCLLIGVLAAALHKQHQAVWLLVLATGFCGGFTTFSTFVLEQQRLFVGDQVLASLLYVGVSLVAGVIALLFGMWLGHAIAPSALST